MQRKKRRREEETGLKIDNNAVRKIRFWDFGISGRVIIVILPLSLMGNCFGTCLDATKVPSRSIHSLTHPIPTVNGYNDEDKPEALPIQIAPRSEGGILSSPHLKAFTFNDLKNVTRNFRPNSLLGQGGFGHVYKGWIDEHSLEATRLGFGMIVAVKKLKSEGFQGHKEWMSEVNYLGQLHHRNLVKLIGYCLDGDNRLLVYEYMPKGSLENHLFCTNPATKLCLTLMRLVLARDSRQLPWSTRIKVAVGATQGLTFLHESKQPLIYRDFKASNILLDSFNAKLSDFGLVKAGPTGDHSHVSTQVMGTEGYAGPEYIATGTLTAKCDVYSFGVVLLELLSGRRAIDKTKSVVEQNLVDWARPYMSNRRKLLRIMDTKLEGQYPKTAAHTTAILALQCISEAKFRPQMSEVLATLEKLPTMRLLVSASPMRDRDNKYVTSPNAKSPFRHSLHNSVGTRKSVSSYISDISVRSPLTSPLKSPMVLSPTVNSPRMLSPTAISNDASYSYK